MSEPETGALWTRYVDWCSARVAGRFLELSAEQIWELAHRSGPRRAPVERVAAPESPYLELVRQVTLELFSELGLPSYQEWTVAYRADPAAYDGEILGYRERGEVPPPRVR
jgi:hypothetical protein